MALSGLGLLLVSATVLVHVEEARGVGGADAERIAKALASGIASRTGQKTEVRTGLDACGANTRCAETLRTSAKVDELVLVRLVGGLSRIRVFLQRASTGESRDSELDIAKDPATWPASMDGAASILYPQSAAATPALETPPIAGTGEPNAKEGPPANNPPPAPSGSLGATDPATTAVSDSDRAEPGGVQKLIPWVVIGGSAVLAGMALGFGVHNSNVEDAGIAERDPVLRQDLEDQLFTTGLTANVLWTSAAVGLATGVVLLILDLSDSKPRAE